MNYVVTILLLTNLLTSSTALDLVQNLNYNLTKDLAENHLALSNLKSVKLSQCPAKVTFNGNDIIFDKRGVNIVLADNGIGPNTKLKDFVNKHGNFTQAFLAAIYKIKLTSEGKAAKFKFGSQTCSFPSGQAYQAVNYADTMDIVVKTGVFNRSNYESDLAVLN